MEDSHKEEAFGYEEEKESILKNPRSRPRNSAAMSNATARDKTTTQQLMQKLDKIVIVLLVLLLVMFFLQPSNSQPKKSNLVKSDLQLDLEPKDEDKDKQEQTPGEVEDSNVGKSKVRSSLEDILKQLEGKGDSQGKEIKAVKDSSQAADQQESQTEDEESEQTKTAKYVPHRRRSEQFQLKQRNQHFQLLRLAKYNLDDPQISKDQRTKAYQQEYSTLQSQYKINEFPQQLSICMVIHSSSHKKWYAHEYALNSVLNQNYSDYTVVYIADGYDADEVQPIKQFLKKKDRKRRVKLVWNNEKKYFLSSTVTAIRAFCMQKKITTLMDGDDELLGAHVFQLINTFYRRHNANFVYGNYIEYHAVQQQMRIGFSTEFEDAEKRQNTYRSVGQKFGSIKTFKTRLISFIKDSDLKDKGGEYYRYAGDYALIYPLLELSCGEVRYMPQYNYLYFGYQIDPTFGSIQIANGRAIRERQRYQCFKEYK